MKILDHDQAKYIPTQELTADKIRASKNSNWKWYCWFHENKWKNDLSEKVKLISTKRINRFDKYRILNGAKYFFSDVLQNYLIYISANKYIEFFSGTLEIYSWNTTGISKENNENPPGVKPKFCYNFH